MKVMVIMKASEQSEAGALPSERVLKEMGDFNEELVKAGIMVAGEGLQPTSKGKRIHFFKDGKTELKNGPFGVTNELIAGYWIWEVKSLDEAVQWAKRIPNTDNEEFEVELRALATAEDFGEAYTPEVRAQEERLRQQLPH